MKRNVLVHSFLMIVLVVALSAGCQKRAVTPPSAGISQPGEQPAVTQPERGAEKIVEQKVETIASKDVAPRYTEEKRGMFEDILFDFDRYDVKDQYRPVLQSVSAWITKNPKARLSIEGHCDDRGTNEYNLALGDRRAKAVKDFLMSLGVPSGSIETISYGEERPACTEQSEGCWSRNRRAHFVVLQ